MEPIQDDPDPQFEKRGPMPIIPMELDAETGHRDLEAQVESLTESVETWKEQVDHWVRLYEKSEAEVDSLREENGRLEHLHDLDHKLADQWKAEKERLDGIERKLAEQEHETARYHKYHLADLEREEALVAERDRLQAALNMANDRVDELEGR